MNDYIPVLSINRLIYALHELPEKYIALPPMSTAGIMYELQHSLHARAGTLPAWFNLCTPPGRGVALVGPPRDLPGWVVVLEIAVHVVLSGMDSGDRLRLSGVW